MIDHHFEIYKTVNSRVGEIVRLFLFIFILLFMVLGIINRTDIRLPFSLLAFLIINELFIDSLSKRRPPAKVREMPKNLEDALIFSARKKFVDSETCFGMIQKIKNSNEGKFFMKKIGDIEISDVKISKAELLTQSFELVKWIKGDYITEIDLFASYLLLAEEETHLLSGNKLANDDLINVLYWTGREFRPDDFSQGKIKLLGQGVFDSLVTGWNYELKKYSRDVTIEVMSKHFPPNIIGTEKAYDELVIGLSKHKSSNVIIVGEAGTGKSTLVEYLAYSCFMGKAPNVLLHKRVYELFADRLISGVTGAGDLESRISAVFEEVAATGDSIVFIRNIENIFGGGGLGLDVSGLLEEYLSRSKIKIIGTTTPDSYDDFIRSKTSIADLFEKVEVVEPEGGKVMLLLTDKAREIESKYKLSIKYSALKQSIMQAGVYYPDRFFPGAAIDLLENVASRAEVDGRHAIDGDEVIKLVEGKTKVAIAEPDKDEKEKLLHLEENIHERVIGQDDAVRAVSDAMRRVRAGFNKSERPISNFLFLGPTGVGKTETAKALAGAYFGSSDNMIRLDMSEYQTQDQIERLIGSKEGEEYIHDTLVDKVRENPFCLLLLDEFEKAHPQLLNLFLQVLDEGRMTDNHGKPVSFKNCIIIATSNAGAEFIRERFDKGVKTSKEELTDHLLRENIFSPELINRFDDVIVFNFLSPENVKKIAAILLDEEFKNFGENRIKINFDESIISKIAEEAYDPEFGARNIRRYIEDSVESFMAKQVLEDRIKFGEVKLTVDQANQFVIT